MNLTYDKVFKRHYNRFSYQILLSIILLSLVTMTFGCFKGYSINDVNNDKKILEEVIKVGTESGGQLIRGYQVLQTDYNNAVNNIPVKIVPDGWKNVSVGHKDGDSEVSIQFDLPVYTDGLIKMRLYSNQNDLLETVDRKVTFEANKNKTISFSTRYSLSSAAYIVIEYNQYHTKLFNTLTWPPSVPTGITWMKR